MGYCRKFPEDIDYVCRPWFLETHLGEVRFVPASISFGGALFATAYLARKKYQEPNKVTFAYWPPDHGNGDRGSLEKVSISAEYDGDSNAVWYSLTRDREFGDKQSVDEAEAKLSSFYPVGDVVDLLTRLRQSVGNLPKGNQLSLAVADFFRERSRRTRLGLQLIPFIPINIGELHNVVPVGEVFGNLRPIIDVPKWRLAFNYWRELCQMFSFRSARWNLMGSLGVGDPTKRISWETDSPLGSYRGGWTFVGFQKQDPDLLDMPWNFLTLEPGFPFYPYGNSHTGATAAAIVRRLLGRCNDEGPVLMRGRRLSPENQWIEKAFQRQGTGEEYRWRKTVRVKLSDNTCQLVAPVRYLGNWVLEDSDFVQKGLG